MKNKGLLQLGVTIVTEKRPMPSYLFLRNGTYVFRRAVPEHLQRYFLTKGGKPRTEFVISLRTKNQRDAKRLVELQAVRTTADLDDAQRRYDSGIKPRHPDSSGPVESPYEARLRIYNEENERQAEIDEFETDAEDESYLSQFNVPFEELTPKQRVEFRFLSSAARESAGSVAKRTQAYEEAGKAFSEKVALHGIEAAVSPPYPRMMKIFDDYVSVARLAPASVKSWRRVIQHLIDHLGHDNALNITLANLRSWRDAVQNEPLRDGNKRTAKTVRDTYVAAINLLLQI